MSLFNFFKKNKGTNPENSEYNKAVNDLFTYLNFNNTQKKGVAFMLGLTLPISALNTNFFDTKKIKTDHNAAMDYINSIVSLYAKGPYIWNDFEELDINKIKSIIYNFNFIYWKCIRGLEKDIDENLKHIPELDIVVGKTELDPAWVGAYSDKSFNMYNVNTLYYDFISKIGEVLLKRKLSPEESYKAGVALNFHLMSFDIEGTHFLIHSISSNTTPLFSALREYPILYKYHPVAFKANHILSSVFQFFTMGIDRNILGPVHTFHQMLFYENGSTKLRDLWDINKVRHEMIVAQVIHNAISIRRSQFYKQRDIFLNSNEIYDSTLKGATLSKELYYAHITNIIQNKFGYRFDSKTLRSSGEFIEFVIMLYYEVCIHSMVIEEITD